MKDNVRRVGNRAFFKKGDRWIDTGVKPEDEAKAIVIEQFGVLAGFVKPDERVWQVEKGDAALADDL